MNIITQSEILLIGIEVNAPRQALSTQIPDAWQQLYHQLDQLDPNGDPILVEVSLSCQQGIYRQLVSCQVTSSIPAPEGLTAIRIPPASYLHHTHEGPVSQIAETFGDMLQWAAQEHIPTSDLKLDFGYTQTKDEQSHELLIALQPPPQWQRC